MLSPEQQQIKLQLTQEFEQKEQFLCPANRNHKLGTRQQLQSHLSTCKEVSHPTDVTYVFRCQFFSGHLFLDKNERDKHEEECCWGTLPGVIYDKALNNYYTYQPSIDGKRRGQPSQGNQKNHYEYALKKGLIKQKKVCTDEVPKNTFEFNKDFRKVDETIKQKIYCCISDSQESQVILWLNEVTATAMPLNAMFIQFISGRFPYNEHFRQKAYYEEGYKNQIVEILQSKTPPQNKYKFNGILPIEILQHLLIIDSYQHYLRQYIDEFVISEGKLSRELESSMYFTIPSEDSIYIFISLPAIAQIKLQICEKILLYASKFSHLVAFEIKLTPQNKYILQDVVNLNELLLMQYQQEEQKQHPQFEEEIDYDEQKQIGQCKAQIQQLNQQHHNLLQIIHDKKKEQAQKVEQNKKLDQRAHAYLEAIKQTNTQLDQYRLQIEQLQTDLQKKNKEIIQQVHQKLNIEFERKQIEQNSKHKNTDEELLKLREELQELKVISIKYSSDIQRLHKEESLLKRDVKSLEEQQTQDFQKIVASEYYYGKELVFKESQQILCKTCQIRKCNIVSDPCMHACLCQICYDKVEPFIPNICHYCEAPSKGTFRIRWEDKQ